MTITTLETLRPEVRIIADSLAVQWPGIDRDDIEQEMMLALVERWHNLSKHEDARKVSLGLAKKAGTQYCAGERHYYQMQTAEWIYTPSEVRALLAEFYTADAWEDAPRKPEGSNQTLWGDGVSVPLMDVRDAIESLPEQAQAAILDAYSGGVSPSTSAEKMRLSRAVDAITAILNRQVSRRFDHADHDGPGSRHAVPNGQARAMTASNY